MGYMRHHAIVVTSWKKEAIRAAHASALATGAAVSEIVGPTVNGYESFFVAPDGSKEGWADSEAGDAARRAIIASFKVHEYEDGASPLKWVEVQFGDDDRVTMVCSHSDAENFPHA
jgi:hypothetical protein